ncbi:MAG: DHH family phosphoesterase, partial [Thermoplasmatota archaeon]
LVGDNRLNIDIKDSLESRDIECNIIEDFEVSKINSLIEGSRQKIEGIIFLFLEKEEIESVSNSIKDEDIEIIAVEHREKKIDSKDIDISINENESIKNSVLREIENIEFKKKSKELVDILSGDKKKVAIFIHNNPDPDAIASAMALEKICEYLGQDSTTYYGGVIGHPENEVFLNSTGFSMKNVNKKDVKDIVEESDFTAFIDFAEASINNIVPKEILPDIIIDHHYTNRKIETGSYTEIRTDIGAASTLMTKHLQNLRINIDPLLASALLYGIKVDTHDYTKNISTADFEVIAYLTALADKELLDIFESPPMKSETLSALGRAINSRDFEDGILTASAGHVTYKDDIPQIAELLMRERDVMSVLVIGILEEKIHLSARSKDIEKNIGKIMKEAFSDIGSAGGHRHSAGGEIPIDVFESVEKAKIDIIRRFKSEMNKK